MFSPNSKRVRPSGSPIAVCAGIGLKAVHYEEILNRRPDIGWFEIHPENYMGEGGPPHRYLSAIREHYPLSLHSVGLSLGSTAPVDDEHLARIAALIDRYEPAMVSDHLSWSTFDGRFFNDLLPLPYTQEALTTVARNVVQVQERLKRRILVENPSTYLTFSAGMPEAEFLAELVRRTDCGILLDVNNIYVSACNHGWDADAYLRSIPPEAVEEIHLAGHLVEHVDDAVIRVDDHGSAVCDAVWRLYEAAIDHVGWAPTLIEWDANIPALDVLIAEAAMADQIADRCIQERLDAAAE